MWASSSPKGPSLRACNRKSTSKCVRTTAFCPRLTRTKVIAGSWDDLLWSYCPWLSVLCFTIYQVSLSILFCWMGMNLLCNFFPGETLLSPLVMCGPHGLKFLQPVELRLPHCASVNPDSWSFALKSSDSPSGSKSPLHTLLINFVHRWETGRYFIFLQRCNLWRISLYLLTQKPLFILLLLTICLIGQPTQWQNMTLAGLDGVSQGRVGKNSVSVLVDHFWTDHCSQSWGPGHWVHMDCFLWSVASSFRNLRKVLPK